MIKYICSFVIIFFVTNLVAQKTDFVDGSNEILENLAVMKERMPRFPGCEHLSNNVDRKKCSD